MFSKSLIALSAALIVVTSLASAANAQRAPRQSMPAFSEAEQNWFDIAEGRERLPN